MLKQRKVNGQSVSRQLATSSENLVTSTQFLVALATSESQFRALCSLQIQPPLRAPSACRVRGYVFCYTYWLPGTCHKCHSKNHM